MYHFLTKKVHISIKIKKVVILKFFLVCSKNRLTTFKKKEQCMNYSKLLLAPLLLLVADASLYASRVLIRSKQGKSGFAGLTFKDNRLFICANPNHIDIFNPNTRRFEDTAFIVPNFDFADDIAETDAITETEDSPTFALSCFLSGQIVTFNTAGDFIYSLTGPYETATETGIYEQQFNFVTQGADPIAYRASNEKLYFQAFDPSLILYVDLLGSTTSSVSLDVPTGLNGMQFGLDDKLYAPAPGFGPGTGQIVKIDADTGVVTPLVSGLNTPIAAKVASNGVIYFIERTTAKVFKYNPANNKTKLLATLEPPLDNLCLNPSENKLFVTNNQNKIYKVSIETGNVKTIYESPITQVWDMAYDPTSDSLYLGDNGILQQVNAKNGNPMNSFILDSDDNQFANGFGIISGLEVETTGTYKIITMADITIGNILVLEQNGSSFSFHDFFSGFETGLFTRQNFSTVRVTGGAPSEYYLALDAVGGEIKKIYRSGSSVAVETYFSGLNTPVKLKKHNGYLYVVEAGQLNAGVPNSGRVSRLPIQDTAPIAADQLVLLDNLNNPQGMDIYSNKILVLEVGNARLLQGSATAPSSPTIVATGLKFTDVVLVSNLNPIPVDPIAGFATDSIGKRLYISQNDPSVPLVNILKIKRSSF